MTTAPIVRIRIRASHSIVEHIEKVGRCSRKANRLLINEEVLVELLDDDGAVYANADAVENEQTA